MEEIKHFDKTKRPEQKDQNSFNFRVFEQDLDPKKVVRFALTRVYGLGLHRATEICKRLGISDSTRVKDLKEADILRIQDAAKELDYELGNDLRRILIMNKARLDSIRCRRAVMKQRGLPCRGQRTHSNGSTASKLRGKC